jgi:hypothetical protein
LGLVEEEDGIDLVVEEAEGPVRVVCPNAPPEINSVAMAPSIQARVRLDLEQFADIRFPDSAFISELIISELIETISRLGKVVAKLERLPSLSLGQSILNSRSRMVFIRYFGPAPG